MRLVNFRAFSSVRKRIYSDDVAKLAEVKQREKLLSNLLEQKLAAPSDTFVNNYKNAKFDEKKSKLLLDATLATFLLHVEARIASSKGIGFYTIGPCGEETLASIGSCFQSNDASALHYRHVAAEVARQLEGGTSIEQVILDRARGYTCSTLDPVTGGRHCAIGGSKNSYLVTSTLASQAPPAVGRALAIPLLRKLKISSTFDPNSLSFVTVGDGSINNAHFLSAINMAEYAQHTGRKVLCACL